MEAIRTQPSYIDYAVNLIAGILVVFAAIVAFGYGAAIAIPKSILEPIVQLSPILAFSLVDLFTQGIPASLIFAFISSIIKVLKINVIYTLVTMPFVLFMLSAIPELFLSTGISEIYLASLLAKVLPVVLFALFLAKREKVVDGA